MQEGIKEWITINLTLSRYAVRTDLATEAFEIALDQMFGKKKTTERVKTGI